MYLINNITSDPQQKLTLIVPTTGVSMNLQICYKPVQQGWYIVSLSYGDFALNSKRITNQLNMLRQWKNILPFGMACISADNREPTLIHDFSSGASKLYILSADEVAQYEAYLIG